MQWISAIRPLCGTSTALLVISGFRHAHQPTDWSVVIAVFFITSMAMLCNDYHDREIDVAKGHLLASLYPVQFLRYTMTFAAVSLGLSLPVLLHTQAFGLLCLGMWITSITYYKLQNNPVGKNITVSLNVGATVIFPLLVDSRVPKLWFMAIFIVVITSAREFMKDVEDMEVDRGKKRTFALVMNSRIKKDSATRWKHFMTLLLVALIVWCLNN